MVEDRPHEVSKSLLAARAGSREALGEALEAYRNYLLAVAGDEMDSALKPKGGASDIVQQTFLEAQRDFPQFVGKSEAEFRAWLKRMLLNNVANFRRHYQQTAMRQVVREVPVESDRSSRDWRQALVASTDSPSGQAMAEERSQAITRALARLPQDYRRVIELRYSESRSFEEIAQTLNRSVAAVRKLWARAVKRLQQEMRHGDGT